MLKEIFCPIFNEKKIFFHNGLNIILGDDEAKNSIGKSSALMAIDFAFGGDSLLDDKSGVISEFGDHTYRFSFLFSGQQYFYSRSTSLAEIVSICDNNYTIVGELTIVEFRSSLKEKYHMELCKNTFRDLVSPFSRIWGKDNIDPDTPFSSYSKEASGKAINRLVDIFGYSSIIINEKKAIDELSDKRGALTKSMKANIIPQINKSKYKENANIIKINLELIDRLKQGFQEALSVYEDLFDKELIDLQTQKNKLHVSKTEITVKIRRIEREIKGITPNLAENIALIKEFFPTINVERLEQVEVFHRKISATVKKQLKEELLLAISNEKQLEREIDYIEKTISQSLDKKGMPNDLFVKVFELKENTDIALAENVYFDQKEDITKAIKKSKEELSETYDLIFYNIQNKINLQLVNFNKVVYGLNRKSSKLIINKENSFSFSSQADTGTGKSYAGLVGFDLAMLKYTHLPIIIHDSIIYKNIEVDAIKNIIRILSNIKRKQIFISFDEAKKYGIYTEYLINKNAVLKINNGNLLYTRDWRKN